MSAASAAVIPNIKTKLENDTLKKKSEIIYIPQGFSGRLIKDSIFGIDSLYTDDYSICNILVCLSQDKSKGVLCHIDANVVNNWEKINVEIEWVGKDQDLFILTRTSGTSIKSRILAHLTLLNLKFPIKIHEKTIGDEFDGVVFSLNSDAKNNLHPHIKSFLVDIQPNNLRHHPQEQAVLTVQKIEQIIGLLDRAYKKHVRNKQFSIFDGKAWESLDAETKFEVLSEHTQVELDFFSPTDLFNQIAGQLLGVMKNFREKCPSPTTGPAGEENFRKSAMDVAFFLETYLNKYDNAKNIFYRNTIDVFKNDGTPTNTAQDRKIQEEVLGFHSAKAPVAETDLAIRKYEKEAPASQYKKDVLPEYKLIHRHYFMREKAAALCKKHQAALNLAKKLNAEALTVYKAEKYTDSAALFMQALQHLTFSALKNDIQLASLYYNYGKTLIKLSDYKTAYQYILNSLTLKQSNKSYKLEKTEVDKIKAALLECQKMKEFQTKLQDGSKKEAEILLQYGLNNAASVSVVKPEVPKVSDASIASAPK